MSDLVVKGGDQFVLLHSLNSLWGPVMDCHCPCYEDINNLCRREVEAQKSELVYPMVGVKRREEFSKSFSERQMQLIDWHRGIRVTFEGICGLLLNIRPESLIVSIISFDHGVAPLGCVRTPTVAGDTMALYNVGGVA